MMVLIVSVTISYILLLAYWWYDDELYVDAKNGIAFALYCVIVLVFYVSTPNAVEATTHTEVITTAVEQTADEVVTVIENPTETDVNITINGTKVTIGIGIWVIIFFVLLYMTDSVVISLVICWVIATSLEKTEQVDEQGKPKEIIEITNSDRPRNIETRFLSNGIRSKTPYYIKKDEDGLIVSNTKNPSIVSGSNYNVINKPRFVKHSSGTTYACTQQLKKCYPIENL